MITYTFDKKYKSNYYKHKIPKFKKLINEHVDKYFSSFGEEIIEVKLLPNNSFPDTVEAIATPIDKTVKIKFDEW